MWWCLVIYLAIAAFVYGLVNHNPDPNSSISDEALGLALGWPVILPALIVGVVFVFAFGLLLLLLFPFHLLGYMTYVLIVALRESVKAKKLQK